MNLILFILICQIKSTKKSFWNRLKNRIKTKNVKSFTKWHDILRSESISEKENLLSDSKSSIGEDNMICDDKYEDTSIAEEMSIVEGFSSNSETKLDHYAYGRFLVYEMQLLDKIIHSKKREESFIFCAKLLIDFPKDCLIFNIKKEQRINFIKATAQSLSHEIVEKLPEAVGILLKFVEIHRELKDIDFLATLLRLNFCINVLNSNSQEIYKKISNFIIEDTFDININRILRKIYSSLWSVDKYKYFDNYISNDLIKNINLIIYLLKPEEASRLKNTLYLSHNENYETQLEVNSSIFKAVTTVNEKFLSVFGRPMDFIGFELLNLQYKYPGDLKKQFDLIGKAVLKSFL
ncbi:hypothetical protein NGRA_0017 [Nosema granulosis]|uniref:Uncharacterized protein n=1 Tax=Nosema granulosis TaxID=83296 RepID=A0A9P6L0F1_9MICR|nr:hypothetical protein NGRA_0017 [Nosema granulosis]